jgi:outer membrane protein assembly factor BamB
VTGDEILVATTDGRLVALPADGCGAPTCASTWEAPLGGAPTQAPAVGGDVVYATAGSRILAFPAGGYGAAICDPLVTLDAGLPVTGGPVVDDGRVLVGTESGRVVAFGLPR